jgi:hypothetical protein
MIQFIIVDEISLVLVRKEPSPGFVVGYCPQMEVHGDWFLPVRLWVGRFNDNYNYALGP